MTGAVAGAGVGCVTLPVSLRGMGSAAPDREALAAVAVAVAVAAERGETSPPARTETTDAAVASIAEDAAAGCPAAGSAEGDDALQHLVTRLDARNDLGLTALGVADGHVGGHVLPVDHLDHLGLAGVGVVADGRGRDLGHVIQLLDDDGDGRAVAGVEAARIARDVDDHRKGRDVRTLVGDEADRGDGAVVRRGGAAGCDGGLVARGDLPELEPEPEPVPEPELLAPPPPLPVPLTSWPTVRLTEATVPEMVEVRDASARLVCAVEREDSADVTAASSESICVAAAPESRSLVSRSSAEATCALAASRSAWSAVVSMVARTCPGVTVWPALTSTAVTVPDTAKSRLA